MYTLKSIAQRGTLLGTAAALLVAAVLPATSAFADALNPLTNRSLTLSSSAPGWDFKDGSGNSTYAPPNSGANGQKSGNTFSFNVSTNSSSSNQLKGMTFQYCTTSAGDCMAPGNIPFVGTSPTMTRAANDATSIAAHKSDLEVKTSSPSELSTLAGYINTGTGEVIGVPAQTSTGQNFVVLWNNAGTWTQSTGWSMTATSNQTVSGVQGDVLHGTSTEKANYIKLTNSGGLAVPAGAAVKVIFFGTNTNYITNPGAGAFFVKINDYNSNTTLDDTTLVDGGVTVANVMNQSIEIQTKVLETMDFSVGVVDPYTLNSTGGAGSQLATASGLTKHGQCDPILKGMVQNPTTPNTLQLGDQTAENSLSTSRTYSTHSYWRLSSNSSAGATVYYSGSTLANTVNDKIAPIGTTADVPKLGTPQFGLALSNGTIAANGTAGVGKYTLDYTKETDNTKGVYENGADNGVAGIHASVAGDVASLTGYHAPQLYPLIPEANYDQGAGVVNTDPSGGYGTTTSTKFAFDGNSNLIPTPIASESASVVDCVTAKVRYIANIAATTPAGIYTTKINYIAAPQY